MSSLDNSSNLNMKRIIYNPVLDNNDCIIKIVPLYIVYLHVMRHSSDIHETDYQRNQFFVTAFSVDFHLDITLYPRKSFYVYSPLNIRVVSFFSIDILIHRLFAYSYCYMTMFNLHALMAVNECKTAGLI